MLRILATAALAFGLNAAPADAQQNVGFTPYGVTCDFFGSTGQLVGNFDQPNQVMTLQFDAPSGCCNTFLAGRFLLLGTPLIPGISQPPLLPTCELSVLPFLAVPFPSQGDISFTLPPLPIGDTFYLQGLADYFTTIGLTHDLFTTNGLVVTIL